ncbi:hypothetical protein HOC96_05080 [archaeon]|nr:hypothetical protein [archaeon]
MQNEKEREKDKRSTREVLTDFVQKLLKSKDAEKLKEEFADAEMGENVVEERMQFLQQKIEQLQEADDQTNVGLLQEELDDLDLIMETRKSLIPPRNAYSYFDTISYLAQAGRDKENFDNLLSSLLKVVIKIVAKTRTEWKEVGGEEPSDEDRGKFMTDKLNEAEHGDSDVYQKLSDVFTDEKLMSRYIDQVIKIGLEREELLHLLYNQILIKVFGEDRERSSHEILGQDDKLPSYLEPREPFSPSPLPSWMHDRN